MIVAAFAPVTISDVVLTASASNGVTFYPPDNVDVDKLLVHADQAVHVAKE